MLNQLPGQQRYGYGRQLYILCEWVCLCVCNASIFSTRLSQDVVTEDLSQLQKRTAALQDAAQVEADLKQQHELFFQVLKSLLQYIPSQNTPTVP